MHSQFDFSVCRFAGKLGISRKGLPQSRWYTVAMDDPGATSHDTSRHDATPYDPLRHTLTVREVELQLSAAGVGRTPRTIQRLCDNRVFDAAQLGGNGEWFIAPELGAESGRRSSSTRRLAGTTCRDASRHVAT